MEKVYKNFIFDIDGTLIDTESISTKTLDRAIQEICNIKLREEDLVKHFGIPSTDFFRMYNLGPVDKIIEKWNTYYYEEAQLLFPEVKEVLNKLFQNNYILGIVTSRVREELKDLDDLEIGKYFKTKISADDTINHKPHGEPIEKIINDLNLKKEETIYIGDTIYDSQSAKNAGIDFGLALWGARDKTISCDILLENPNQILKCLKK